MSALDIFEIAFEYLVAVQALWYLRKHPLGYRRLVAILVLGYGVLDTSIDFAHYVMGAAIVPSYQAQAVLLLFIIWLMFQRSDRAVIGPEDAVNLYARIRKALLDVEWVSEKLEQDEEDDQSP